MRAGLHKMHRDRGGNGMTLLIQTGGCCTKSPSTVHLPEECAPSDLSASFSFPFCRRQNSGESPPRQRYSGRGHCGRQSRVRLCPQDGSSRSAIAPIAAARTINSVVRRLDQGRSGSRVGIMREETRGHCPHRVGIFFVHSAVSVPADARQGTKPMPSEKPIFCQLLGVMEGLELLGNQAIVGLSCSRKHVVINCVGGSIVFQVAQKNALQPLPPEASYRKGVSGATE